VTNSLAIEIRRVVADGFHKAARPNNEVAAQRLIRTLGNTVRQRPYQALEGAMFELPLPH